LSLDEARQAISEIAAGTPEVAPFSEFLAASSRGIVR
jgi:UDP-N-acetylglucosamine acyltransferase